MPRTERGRERLALHARQLALEPHVGFAALRVKSYDDIVDHCCFAWNNLVSQLWRIMSIGMRQWAHGS
jgi:hypothetical protein